MFPTRAYMLTGDAEQLNSYVASLKDDDFQTFFFFLPAPIKLPFQTRLR